MLPHRLSTGPVGIMGFYGALWGPMGIYGTGAWDGGVAMMEGGVANA